ncbi:hypothetical protein CONPUDRAFT_170253 [Coniophora puteana RWD-64-598 SS2]|uniref:Berberine/berberine-like domain-containing protein n=1 Tax=Coniophora puteana (strain RWD-64-598) TaxID=741705 RepID=R7SEH4_CONPW|nr:uncharacterized protein CONPUDRAFT_170253 [Coniophora puteana RWD-64-598 SS2]EIW74240.1 hypothetical protein CONPUDRAFT_170253 [Coniophora puteana RWD-64-598 SS2]
MPRWTNSSSQLDKDSEMLAWARQLASDVSQAQARHASVLSQPGAEGFQNAPVYSNYATGDERSSLMFGDNYPRLQHIKAKYDRNNVFNKWFPITPDASA